MSSYSPSGGTLKRSTGKSKIQHMHYVLNFRDQLNEAQEREANRRIEAEIIETCQQIRDLMDDQTAYDLWWDGTPDVGFLQAARAKLAELQSDLAQGGGHE